MGQAALGDLLRQLMYQSPQLLVCLIGFVLGLVYMSRHRSASLLAIWGTVLMMVTTLVAAAVHAYLLDRFLDEHWPADRYAMLSGVVAIVGSVLRGIGLALIVAAVFVGRRPAPPPEQPRYRRPRTGDDDLPPAAESESSTAIKE
jgi:hypothetical protein